MKSHTLPTQGVKLWTITLALTGTLLGPVKAQAEGQVRFADQVGVVYLLLNIAKDLKLIEMNANSVCLVTLEA